MVPCNSLLTLLSEGDRTATEQGPRGPEGHVPAAELTLCPQTM